MLNNVFIYWVGNDYKVIKFLRSLIFKHSNSGNDYKVHFLNHDNLNDYIDEIPEVFWKLSPTHQSDFLRVILLNKWGGIWLDSDTIVMDNLSSLFDILKENKGFLVLQPDGKLCNGVIGSIPNTTLLNIWSKKIINKLSTNDKIKWEDLGNSILSDISQNHFNELEGYKILNGKDNIYPVNWNETHIEFLEKPFDNWKNLVRDFQPIVILTNKVYKNCENLSESEILSKTPLSYFIKKSYYKI